MYFVQIAEMKMSDLEVQSNGMNWMIPVIMQESGIYLM